ncbi:MAG: hypothetical protein ABIS36_18605 [Chryseolinea sp.]
MKNHFKIFLPSLFVTCILWCCGKDSPPTPIIPEIRCLIQSETYGLSGNEKGFAYEYTLQNDKETLNKVNVLRPNGSISGSYSVGGPFVIYDYTYGSYNMRTQWEYSSPLTEGLLPTNATLLIDDGSAGKVLVDYDIVHFGYDTKGHLTEVKTRRGTRTGGFEYDITIHYNDQGNVTGIKYVYFTGPNVAIPIITVSGYDDKPNPHSGIVGWRFFLINYSWEYGDPGNLIAALSQNNPLGFTMGSGETLFERKIDYEYTTDGYPAIQKNTNKNASGEYSFIQTYTYVCK